jgi:precorrin-2/cobalt-factor-2 C20-methyltransferase
MRETPVGTLYGVGVGPGDPELMTLKALRVLQRVPVVCVPKRGLASDSYSLSIVAGILDLDRQEVLELIFPMTKDRTRLEAAWKTAGAQVAEKLSNGLDCAFITEGDPTLYSTFVHLMRAVRHELPQLTVEVIPGVSSISGVAARVEWSLGYGDERIAIVPATYENELLRETLERFDTVVLMKVNSVVERIIPILHELDLLDKSVYVSRATSSQEEVVWDLRRLVGRKLDYLSTVLVCKKGGDHAG